MNFSSKINPATRSDLFVLPPSTQVGEKNDYLAVHCAAQPNFWFGNYFVLTTSPDPESLRIWVERWCHEFRSSPAVTKMILQWEVKGIVSVGNVPLIEKSMNGFDICRLEVLSLQDLAAPSEIKVAEPRQVRGTEDWNAALAVLISSLADTPGGEKFLRWRLGEYRKLVEAGRGEWWVSWKREKAVGTAGIFWDDHLIRFQEVVTHPTYRRLGVCTHLCHAMLCHNGRQQDSRQTLVATDLGSDAFRIYSRLGFNPIGIQWALIGDRPASPEGSGV